MFGGSSNTTFGGSAFGGFGQNTNTNTNSNTSGSLFGGTNSAFGTSNPSTAFGSTGFGTTTSSGGLFASKPVSAGTGLFGANNTATTFGGSSTFGNTNANNTAFGGGSGSIFGNNTANATTSAGLFGSSTTNTFGSTGGTFGASNTGSSIFGGTASTFGAAQQQNGTNLKYNPLTATDQQTIRGQQQHIQTKLHAICGMKEYENKSLEELRCEDYLAGQKGGVTNTTANTAGGGLFGGATPTSTSSFGGFGAANTGTTGTTGGSLFGNTTTGSSGGLFGSSSTTNKPGSLFGATTNTAAPSLFGNTTTNTPSNTFGATNTGSAFGSTTGGSLFGNTSAVKPSGGLFGGSTATSSSGGLFGNSSTNTFGNTANTGSSLFGSTSLAGNTGGSLFGTTNTANTGGSLFGNTTNKTFGGFGSTNTNTANTSTGFGNTGGSLFGNTNNTNKTGSLFGGSTGTTNLFGNNTSNSFGATNTGGSLFGNTNNNTNKTGSLFGGSTGFNTGNFNSTTSGGSLFGNNNNTTSLLGGNNNQQPVLGASLDSTHIHQVVAALASTPFGDSPLFRTALDEHKKIKPSTPPPASLGNSKSRITGKLSSVRPRPLNGGYNQLFEGLEDDISPSPEAFLPRNSLKKLVLQSHRCSEPEIQDIVEVNSKTEQNSTEEINRQDSIIDTTMNTVMSVPQVTDPRARLSNTPIKNISPIRKLPFTTMSDTQHEVLLEPDSESQNLDTTNNNSTKMDLKTEKSSPGRRLDTDTVVQEDLQEAPILGLDGKPLKAPPPSLPFTLARPEYYTVPGSGALLGMIQGESLVVRDLVIGRAGYGEVKFLGEVDLWGMDLDSTIFFRRKEISVYPSDNNKPPQGQALNRRSEVTLESVYPTDKATRENVTDPKEIITRGFPAYLEKKTFKMGAKFIEYKPETGQWTFMVKHFSQYGLLDSEDEEEEGEEERKDVKKLKEEKVSPENSFDEEDDGVMSDDDNMREEEDQEEEGYGNPHEVSFVPRPMPLEYQGYKAGLFGFNESEEEAEPEEEAEMFIQGSHFNYSSLNISKKTAGLSKTALKMEKLEMSENNFNMDSPKSLPAAKLAKEKGHPGEAAPNFGVSVVPSVLCLPPLSSSIAKGRTHLKMDEGLTRHFAYRASWTSNNGVLAKSQRMSRPAGRSLFEKSRGAASTALETSRVSCGTSPEYHSELLDIQLQHTSFTEQDGEVVAVPNPGSDCLEDLLATLSQSSDITVLGPALRLIKALWADSPPKEGPYASEQFRKARLTAWLGSQLKVLAQKHTIEHAKLGVCHLPAVISWLCAGGVQEACQLLCKAGDFQLALLVSQSSTPIIRQLVLKQLHEWRESGYDALISKDRLKIYVLLSGEQVWESSTRTINVCESLDWLSSFALFMRYLPPSSPLGQAVALFQQAFESGDVTAPMVDEDNNFSVFWQLLMLYCNPAYPLPDVLNNLGITDNMLDERDVWFIWTTLTSLGLPRATPQLATKLVTSYTAQLDRVGLWAWSVFIAQHLPAGRARAVRGIVRRNVVWNGTEVGRVSERERRCLVDYQVEGELFHCARALHARYSRSWGKVVTWYTCAEMFDAAHKVFMDKIAPYKIVSREEYILLPLLDTLHQHRYDIQNWEKQGAIYFSYLNLPASLPQSEEDLEHLRHKISTLGHQLNELPYTTTSEICAVNMMALRTCTMLIEVWRSLFGESDNRELLLTMKTFSLPCDYWIKDIITKLSAEIVSEENFCGGV